MAKLRDTLKPVFRAMDDLPMTARQFREMTENLGGKKRKDRQKTQDQDRYDADGNLKPNNSYRSGEHDYRYETDGNGHIERVTADNLQFTSRTDRLPHAANTPGKLPGDHAGHLIGDRFGGSPELDNIVSQLGNHNLSGYKKLENMWADAIRNGESVSIDIRLVTDAATGRPTEFDIVTVIGKDVFSSVLYQ